MCTVSGMLSRYHFFFERLFVIAVQSLPLSILPTDKYIASALVRQGVMPCSPISPAVAVTIDALELYRVAHLRSPHFSIQSFVKTLCDLHSVSAYPI